MAQEHFYSTERNIQILLALLKAHNIRKFVVSPGATNFSLVESIQNDSYFEIYSSVDERSAAYIACGMAAESGEPVVLSCTGSTASRNYYPGMTEAFYRKLPVLAVTSHQGTDRIGQLIFQQIDRRVVANDAARFCTEIPVLKDERDEAYATLEINKALLELRRNGGGPVHINMFTVCSSDFSVKELPAVRVMRRYQAWDKLPELPKGKIAVYVGSHTRFTENQNKMIELFCATHDAIVICDHTSGYNGKYKLLPTLAFMQVNASLPLGQLDLIIHIGEISGAVFSGQIPTKEVWRVNEDGELRDTFKKLTNVFQMSEEMFFVHYSREGSKKHNFIDHCNDVFVKVYDNIPELPFSNIWTASQLSRKLPKNAIFHLSASNTRRCWNMFYLPEGVESTSNVGCCGIDGATSSLIGASLVRPNKLCYLVTGDLAFFYDLNTLGNRHIGKNLRILLINNGIGAEFKLSTHACACLKDDANKFVAASGHFGNKSPILVKHFSEDLGFRYLSATTKKEFLASLDEFTNPTIGDRSIIFEIFTSHENESDALQLMTHIDEDSSILIKKKAVDAIKSAAGEKGIKIIRNILGKK